jgi:hypothetical protein
VMKNHRIKAAAPGNVIELVNGSSGGKSNGQCP